MNFIKSYILLFGLFICLTNAWAQIPRQKVSLYFKPIFKGENVAVNKPLYDRNNDSLSIHSLKFYLSNFTFLQGDRIIWQEEHSYHLLDLENEKSFILKFLLPARLDFDKIQFNLGVDSLTNVAGAGAMGGDLDPIKGMYWTWQSGYINCKIEGFYKKCPSHNHLFQFHLGGYLPPFQSVQNIEIAVIKNNKIHIDVDLFRFFENIKWDKKQSIMSPSKEAVDMLRFMPKIFLYEE